MFLSFGAFNEERGVKIILGISAYYHDSAASLIVDGKIVAAVQEERFSRKKNTEAFPVNAIKYCLKQGGISLDDLDAVVFYDKPFLKFERLLENFYAIVPRGLAVFLKFMPEWSQKKIFLKSVLKKELKACDKHAKKPINLLFSSHHLSHAASAFYPSPFQEAAILTIDAVGEWATASIGHGKGSSLELIKEMHFPDSVGVLYSSFTYFIGFKVNSGEYKLMGLSPYGNPDTQETQDYIHKIKTNLVTIFDDGSIRLNQHFFNYRHGLKMIKTKKWENLFGIKLRNTDQPLSQQHANLALAIQLITEEIVLKMAKTAKALTNSSNLCLAGGVALNSVANGKLLESGLFEDIWVQPAAGDAGGALGAALAVYYHVNPSDNSHDKAGQDEMQMSLLGPSITTEEIEEFCRQNKLKPTIFESFDELDRLMANELAENKVIGWVRGRMEFGPRALGARSILASPYKGEMQKKLNQRIKFREDFRPFAPVMLREEAVRYFGMDKGAHYMQIVKKILPEFRVVPPENYEDFSLNEKLSQPRSAFQAITHVDFSSRLQIVDNKNHNLLNLLHYFKQIKGDGILINTSFNTNEAPIVLTIEDAYSAFQKTGIDLLVVENYLFTKTSENVGSH